MIQRIQSIYLLLGALSLVGMLLIDVLWQNHATTAYPWFAPVLLGLGALAALVGFGTIFMYKNRQQQLKMIRLAQLLVIVLIAVLVGVLVLADAVSTVTGAGASGYLGLALPALAYVFYYLARRGVQRDINLVRSMDRLR